MSFLCALPKFANASLARNTVSNMKQTPFCGFAFHTSTHLLLPKKKTKKINSASSVLRPYTKNRDSLVALVKKVTKANKLSSESETYPKPKLNLEFSLEPRFVNKSVTPSSGMIHIRVPGTAELYSPMLIEEVVAKLWTKRQLLFFAELFDVEVKQSWTKTRLVDELDSVSQVKNKMRIVGI